MWPERRGQWPRRLTLPVARSRVSTLLAPLASTRLSTEHDAYCTVVLVLARVLAGARDGGWRRWLWRR